MMDQAPFDDFVKQQFKSYSPDVPGHIWENIVAKRSSRPKGFWFSRLGGGQILLASLVLLLGGGASYYLFSGSKNTAPVTHSQSVAVKDIPVTQKNNTTPAENNNKDNTTVPGNSSAINDPSKAQEHSEANNSSTRLPQQTPLHGNEGNKVSTRSHQPEVFNSDNVNKKENSHRTDNSDRIDETTANISEVNKNIAVSIGKLPSPFGFSTARELSTKNITNRANIKLPECPSLEKNAAGNKTYWEAYAGPDRAFENYKSYGDTTSANYLQKRKASTEFASAFSAGVRYTKVFNNGTSVRAGVNYTQVNEKFLYFNPSEIKYVTVITTRVVIRAPGDTLYFNDTLQYQQTGSRIKTTYNRYRNIDVPLVIGYELGNGRIHANINAGVIINIYSWYKGDVLDSLYQPVTITTGKSNSIYQFKNNIGVGFLGSVSLYYKMTDKLHLLLEPYFRYNLSPMSKENLNLQQKYNIMGIRAGVRVDLK